MSLAGLSDNPNALRLVAAAKSEWQRIGVEVQGSFWNALLDRYVGDPLVDDGDVPPAWSEGAHMGFEEAVAVALRLSSEGTPPAA